jgi:hypothetical protein
LLAIHAKRRFGKNFQPRHGNLLAAFFAFAIIAIFDFSERYIDRGQLCFKISFK